jgi:hypothetical protein
MTGLPTAAFSHNEQRDRDAFFKKMLRFDADHATFLASSKEGTNDKSLNGIILGHAYTVLSWHLINDKNGREVRLVKLRNPWGADGEWIGEWSDKDSNNWTPKLKT